MKNSKEYGQKVIKVFRKLKREYGKSRIPTYDEPVEAIIFAIIAEKLPESTAEAAMKNFGSHFVDLNDLRVARPEEILEVMMDNSATAREAALLLNKVLTTIFNHNNCVSMQGLKKLGKRPAKQALEKIEGMTHFMVNYCMLTAMDAHAIPLTDAMINCLKVNELVEQDADLHAIEGFLTRLIPSKEGYEFYGLLRRESESPKILKKKTKKKKVIAKKVKITKKARKKTK